MNNFLKEVLFRDININDPFFQSLKEDYIDFNLWFEKKQKQNEKAIVHFEDSNITGFLYYKDDGNLIDDIEPTLTGNKILKIGTFKINAKGTRLGEQFIKIVLDYALQNKNDKCYVTIYPKWEKLIELIQKYGFELYGKKGHENVYVKELKKINDDICKSFPILNTQNVSKYLLSVYPKYHTNLFPDSQLKTEKNFIRKDLSYTNSIHKVYICTLDLKNMKKGDIVCIYRTAENGKSAEYSSLVTSICTVEEVKHQNNFITFDDFYNYSAKYTVFDKEDLRIYYNRGNCKIIKMLYNVALPKKIIRHDLIENIGLNRTAYWGFFEISDKQFNDILRLSEIENPYIG